MLKRKELKAKARSNLKRNYLRTIAVCFIVSFILGSLAIPFVNEYDTSNELYSSIAIHYKGKTNSDVVKDLLKGIGLKPISASDIKVSNGVFASVFNNITKSGNFVFGVLNAINQMIFHDKIVYGITLLIGVMIYLSYWLFIKLPIHVSTCRFFEESHLYKGTPINKLLFPVSVKRLGKTAQTMLVKTIFEILWWFTVVGGIIKHYSYYLVPYIVAENPDIGSLDAIRLSKQMMKGKKWQFFLLDMSFLLWNILNAITANVLKYFWLDAYVKSTFCEAYFAVREEAINAKIPGYEYLNDKFLVTLPENPELYTPDVYPTALFSIPEREKRHWVLTEYKRDYSVISLTLIFFSFSIGGWIWEVALQFFNGQGFVNRGVLHGPWLPIYGCGGVLVLLLLKKLIDHPFITFCLTIVICGTVEYFTGWFLETTKGVKWWDYSGYFLQLNGRICAEGLLIFGIGCCAAIYLIAPLLDDLFKRIPSKIAVILCVCLITVFSADFIYSHFVPNVGAGITDNVTASSAIDK